MKHSFVSFVALGAIVAITAGACGSSVDDQTAAGSDGSGAGGEASTSSRASSTTTQSSSSTTTITTVSSTSTGMENQCTRACGHAAGCGLDVCALLPQFIPGTVIDCADPNAQAQCITGCLDGAPCDDITALLNMDFSTPTGICLGGCLAGGAGGGGGGSSVQNCIGCAQGPCAAEAGGCFNDGDCQGWLQCVGGCNGDEGCLTGCDTQFANASGLYVPLEACTCDSCAAECAIIDPCRVNGAGGSGAGAGGAGAGGGLGGSGGSGGTGGAGGAGTGGTGG